MQKRRIKKRFSRLKKVAAAAVLAASIAGVGHLGLRAHVADLNAEIAARNAARPAADAKEVPVELNYRKLLRGRVRSVVNNPNTPGNCSGYAGRVALLFGKRFVISDAWDMPKRNRVVARAGFDRGALEGGFSQGELEKMIREGKISKGTIIGIYYPDSPNNRPERPFTHMLVFVGDSNFWHNLHGPNSITVAELFSTTSKNGGRAFFPVVALEPN